MLIMGFGGTDRFFILQTVCSRGADHCPYLTGSIALFPPLPINEKNLFSIKDRGQSDRVTTTTRSVRCKWPRPRHAARLAALARS